ncbi:hypothetical protein MMC14_010706 [Varicellaria rhodocarpa]|nr:hypothetical protein [Varicellaria rhodocarpa]
MLRNRRAKALSGRSFVLKDPGFDRKAPLTAGADFVHDRNAFPNKRLFDPNTDNTGSGHKNLRSGARPDQAVTFRCGHDSRTHFLRAQKGSFGDQACESLSSHQRPMVHDNSQILEQEHLTNRSDNDVWLNPEPQILLQPETRPITHDQLVVEVKGIYAGLVMVEAKCIDVDEKQAAAAQKAARRKWEATAREPSQEGLMEACQEAFQESDLSHESELTREQWQALIALHKTLLHEHHDFFWHHNILQPVLH